MMRRFFVRPSSWLFITALMSICALYWLSHTAFQPHTTPPPAAAPSAPPAPIARLLEAAERMNRMKNYSQVLRYVQQAQSIYRQMGNEKDALRLYARIMTIYDMDALDSLTKAHFLHAQDSVCRMLEAKSNATQDPELLLISDFIKVNCFQAKAQQDSFLYYANRVEKNAQPQRDWALLLTTIALKQFELEQQLRPNQPLIDSLNQQTINVFLSYQTHSATPQVYKYPNLMGYSWLGSAYMGVAGNYISAADYEKALAENDKALHVFKDMLIPDSLWVSTVYHKIATIYRSKGDHEKVQEYYDKALLYVADRFPHAFGAYYWHIANSYLAQEQYTKAIPFLLLAEQYIYQVKDQPINNLYAPVRFNYIWSGLIQAYLHTKNNHKAQIYLNKIDSLYPITDISKIKRALDFQENFHYAHAYYAHRTQDYTTAAQYYQTALALGGALHAEIEYQWGIMELERGQPQQAAQLFHQNLQTQIKDFRPTDLLHNPTLAQITNKHKVLKPVIQKMDALRQCLAADSTRQLPQAAYQKSIQELADVGVELLASVCNSFEREGSVKSLVELSYRLYESAIEIQYEAYQRDPQPKYLEKAFQFAERSKSILLTGALREDNALQFSGMPDSLLQQEHRYTQDIIFYEQERLKAHSNGKKEQAHVAQGYLLQAKEGLDALKKQMEKDFPRYFQLKYNQTFAHSDSIRRHLQSGDLFVEWFDGRNAVYVFAISSNKGLQMQAIPTNNGYLQRLSVLQRSLTQFDWIKENPETSRRDIAEQGFWLFDNYLAPWWQADTRRLIVAADGQFNYLPFDLLLTKATDPRQPFEQMPFLLRDCAVLYQYSGTLWLQSLSMPQPTAATPSAILGMAAVYPPVAAANDTPTTRMGTLRRTLAPIEGTVQEVAALERHWAGTFVYGEEASETFFKRQAPQHAIIHLAMHGLVDRVQPDYSCLAFSDVADTIDDDFLQVQEIKKLSLDARLVVLSACETGYGKYQRGEGVVSIGRSFVYAGAAALLMSLWSVNDVSTTQIMEQFYTQLQQGNTKSQALRLAKLHYLDHAQGISGHPAYWMPFVVLGDDDNIALAPSSNRIGWWMAGGGAAALLLLFVVIRRRR